MIKVTGPLSKHVRAGAFLDDSKALKLGKSDHIVIVDSKGARAFTGPKKILLSRTSASQLSGTASGMISSGEAIVRLAGVRGIGGHQPGVTGRQSNPYLRTAIKPGARQTVCFLPTAMLMLERSGSDAETLKLEPVEGGTAVTVRFPAYQTQMPWPNAHRPTETAQYRIIGKSKSRTVTLIPVQAGVTDWLELGTFLTKAKCSNGDWVLAQRDWDVRMAAPAPRP